MQTPSSVSSAQIRLAFLALLLPPLWAFTLGPNSNMQPLMVGMVCAGLFLLCSPQGALRRGSHYGMGAVLAALAVHGLVVTPASWPMWLASLLALAAFWALAQAAAGWLQAGKLAWVWLALLLAALLNSAIAALQNQGWATGLGPLVHPGNMARAFGNLRQPNQLATLTAMGFALAIFILPGQLAKLPQQRWLQPLLLSFCLALLAFACAASRSRTGLLQWLLLAAAALYWSWQDRQREPAQAKATALWASLGLLFYALAVCWLAYGAQFLALGTHTGAIHAAGQLAPEGALARLAEAGEDARTLLWSNLLAVAAQKPWLGWGWGNLGWGLLNTPIQGAIFSTSVDNAHMLPLHLAVELGWPLALVFCALVGLWFWRRQPWREAQADKQAALLILAVIGLHSLLEYPLWHSPFLFAAALAFGVLAAAPQAKVRAASGQRPFLYIGLVALGLGLYWAQAWTRTVQIYLPADARSAFFTRAPDWVAANGQTWWFSPYANFATMGTRALTHDNAAKELARAQGLLHYSSEARVLRRARDAAALLGQAALAQHYQNLLQRRWPDAAAAEAQEKAAPASASAEKP